MQDRYKRPPARRTSEVLVAGWIHATVTGGTKKVLRRRPALLLIYSTLLTSAGTWYTLCRTVALFCMTQVLPGAYYVKVTANETTGLIIPTYGCAQAEIKTKRIPLKTTTED